MKKTMIAMAVALLGLAGSGYAASKMDVPVKIEKRFTQRFSDAMDVRWEEDRAFFKATFEDQGRTLFAFYADNGAYLGVATNLSPAALPDRLRASIKNSYSGYWITDLLSFHNAEERGFVVNLENADRAVVLRALGHDGWTVVKTVAKK